MVDSILSINLQLRMPLYSCLEELSGTLFEYLFDVCLRLTVVSIISSNSNALILVYDGY